MSGDIGDKIAAPNGGSVRDVEIECRSH